VRRGVVLVVAAAVTAVAVGAGVLVRGAPGPDPKLPGKAMFRTTPLAEYDTTGVAVTRAPFCAALDDRQVAAALGGPPTATETWANGDPVDLGNGVADVGHEFGCRFTGADGTLAQAWLFAPPVDAPTAAQLVKRAGRAAGCQAGSGPAFGSPTLALTCTKDGVTRASYRGLFGDGWLVCEVARPAGATWDVADRAGRWCVGVLEAAQA
jgi:hypothetical protein